MRFGAAEVLLRLDPELAPSPALLAVCLEGLRADRIRGNAAWGARYLVDHYFAARPELLRALGADDPLVRYRAALIAAHGGETALDAWVPVLVQALAEDDLVANAMGASRMLACRPQTRPWVEAIRKAGSPQQRALAVRILAVQARVQAGLPPGSPWQVDFVLADRRSARR